MTADDTRTPNGSGVVGSPVTRVRKAYEQVHEQLRELIISGRLTRGQRLPNEAALAREFGVSRGTVREALRVLAAENLIRTAKGAGGGSFVTLPTVDHVSEFLTSNIALLSESRDFTPEELLEARGVLEGWAAGAAADRRTEEHLALLRGCIVDDPADLGTEEQFTSNTHFHTGVLDAAQNRLLAVAVQPVLGVMQRNLRRSEVDLGTHRRINEDHVRILEAIEAGDPAAAEAHMRDHVGFLRGTYTKIWAHRLPPVSPPGES